LKLISPEEVGGCGGRGLARVLGCWGADGGEANRTEVEDEGVVGVAGLSGAGWEITAVRFLIGRTRRARALGGTGSFLCCKKGCGLVCLAGQDGSPERSHG